MKYKIGDKIEDTDAYGTVVVIDILISQTTPQYCYHVRDMSDNFYLTWETELNTMPQ